METRKERREERSNKEKEVKNESGLDKKRERVRK